MKKLLLVASIAIILVSCKSPAKPKTYQQTLVEKYGCRVYFDQLSKDTCELKKQGMVFKKENDTLYFSVDKHYFVKY